MGRKEKPNNFEHGFVTAIILFGTASIGCIYPEIISAFSILGGTCSVMLVMTFPGKFLSYKFLFM